MQALQCRAVVPLVEVEAGLVAAGDVDRVADAVFLDHQRFVGRLATYRYYNMDQIVGQALATYRRLAPSLSRRSKALAVTPAKAAS